MPDNIVPEIDRRQKEPGVVRFVFEVLIGKQSRKVAFGIWLFAVANTFKSRADMPWDLWWNCVLLSGALIGLGTIVDELIRKLGDRVIGSIATKINSVTETTKTVETITPTPQ